VNENPSAGKPPHALDPGTTAQVVRLIRERHGPSFAIADRVHAIALRALPQLEPPKTDNVLFTAAVLFGRILTSFQAAYILAERGMCSDARTLVRSQVESTIFLVALATDSKRVIELLLARDTVNKRKLLAAWLDDPQAVSAMTPEHRAQFESALAELKRDHPGLKDEIDVRQLADSCGMLWLYNTAYRLLSSDSAHTSLQALEHHIKTDSKAEILGLRFGPNPDLVPDTLSGAIPALLTPTLCATQLFGLQDQFKPELDAAQAAWKSLSEGTQ
jgi:hypothetical protein